LGGHAQYLMSLHSYLTSSQNDSVLSLTNYGPDYGKTSFPLVVFCHFFFK
jgi:hypothetical protein